MAVVPAVLLAGVLATAGVPAAAAQTGDDVPAAPGDAPPRVLDVPFLPQTPALCGGAAAAMVMRYWGHRSVRPESFGHLVDEAAGGIASDELVSELDGRGWRTHAFRGRVDDLRSHVERGRPPVVLLEVRPDRFHYVVVVAVPEDGVLFHDPARAPFQFADREEFARRWAAADRWTLLLLPPEAGERADGAADTLGAGAGRRDAKAEGGPGRRPPDAREAPPVGVADPDRVEGPCAGAVREGVRRAAEGEEAAADSLLRAAVERCPAAAAPPRELAGLRFRQQRWEEASALARQALEAAPADSQAVHLLAASRYMRGERRAALEAWNRIGRPRVASLRAYGLERTPWDAVAPRLGVSEGDLLTPSRLTTARRRAASVPALARTRVRYRPRADGRADLQVAAVERPLLFGSPLDAAVTAASALAGGELRLVASGPARAGETWSAAWRWRENRPAVELEAAFPQAFGAPGRWTVRGRWERQTFAGPGSAGDRSRIREERAAAGLRFSRWAGAGLRWSAGVELERWRGRGTDGPTFLRPRVSLELRGAGDRAAARAELDGRAGLDAAEVVPRGALEAAWRPAATGGEGWTVDLRAGAEGVASEAPLTLRPGAGTGSGRRHLLRAHPLLDDGVVEGEGFGRILAHGGIEARLWAARVGPLRVGGAVFVDGARPWGADDVGSAAADRDDGPLLLDGGVGLRVAPAPGAGHLRVDVAAGLLDEAGALSAGWRAPWPGW